MQVVSSSNARRHQIDTYMGEVKFSLYFGTPVTMHEGPQAYIVQPQDPNVRLDPHFHDIDQFQVFLTGNAMFGKNEMRPISIHYADAFTPYGPIVARGETFSFLVLRPAASGGYYGMPAEREKMKGRNGQNISMQIDHTSPLGDAVERKFLCGPRADGLAAEIIRIPPNAEAAGLKPAGAGQFCLVCDGRVTVDGETEEKMSLIYIDKDERAPVFRAGEEGAEILVLQYPRPSARPGSDPYDRPKSSDYEGAPTTPPHS
jgi:hypothetical protein